MAQAAFKIGDIIDYGVRSRFGDQVLQVRVYAVFGDKIAIDHASFQRGRTVHKASPKILGLAS